MPKSTGVCIQTILTVIVLSIFVIFNLFILFKKILFLKRAVSVKGKVIKSENSPYNGIPRYFKSVEFKSEKGNIKKVESVFGCSKNIFNEGNYINILYDSKKSKKAVIQSFKDIWGFEIMLFLISCAGLLAYFTKLHLST